MSALTDYIEGLSGLLAYYPFDEASGDAINTAPDTLGTFDGTVTGATQGVTGQSGDCYNFDGTDDIVTVSGLTVKNLSAYSVFSLLYNDGTSAERTIYFEPTNVSGSSRIRFRLTTGSNVELLARAGDAESLQTKSSNSGLAVGWHFIVANVDIANDAISFYDNGSSLASSGTINFSATSVSNTDPATVISLASYYNGSTHFNFYKDKRQHTGLMNRLLTSNEILTMSQHAGLATAVPLGSLGLLGVGK